jgi:hypothetical protein
MEPASLEKQRISHAESCASDQVRENCVQRRYATASTPQSMPQCQDDNAIVSADRNDRTPRRILRPILSPRPPRPDIYVYDINR